MYLNIYNFVRRNFGLIAVITLVAFGGSAQVSRLSDIPVRVLALIILTILYVPGGVGRMRNKLAPLDLVLWGMIFFIPLYQLIALPPVVWSALPGRALYLPIYNALSEPLPWLPISLRPDLTRDALLFLLVPFAAFVAGASLDRRGRRYAVLFWLIAAMLSMVIGIVQIAGENRGLLRFYDFTHPTGALGFFANRNHFAVFLACSIPMAWWLASISDVRLVRTNPIVFAMLYTMGAVIMALATQSRAGIVLAIVASIVSFALHVSKTGMRSSRAIAYGIAGVLLALPVFYALAQPLLSRFEELGSNNGRADIIPALWHAAIDHMPVGSGIGSFASVFPAYESITMLATGRWNHAHNEWLQIPIEAGLAGVVAIMLALYYIAVTARASRHADRPEDAGLVRVALVVTALLMAHSLVDYPLRTPCLAALLAFLWGMARQVTGYPRR